MTQEMKKTVKFHCYGINKGKDKRFILDTCKNVLNAVLNEDEAQNISFSNTDYGFNISYDIRQCFKADILLILIKEWISLIVETEENTAVSLEEIEEDGAGYRCNFMNLKRYR